MRTKLFIKKRENQVRNNYINLYYLDYLLNNSIISELMFRLSRKYESKKQSKFRKGGLLDENLKLIFNIRIIWINFKFLSVFWVAVSENAK